MAQLSFNPLFIGAWVRTSIISAQAYAGRVFQSPLHRGLGSDDSATKLLLTNPTFQSPLHRGLGSD